jgi:hypothetical protein
MQQSCSAQLPVVNVQVAYPGLYVDILLAAGQALAPLIRRFISLGLNRMWLHSGDTIYRFAQSYIQKETTLRVTRRLCTSSRTVVADASC